MASPFLYFPDDRLSLAELSAACLDGDLVELGEAFIPADAVETAALRAGSLQGLLGGLLAASHLSAAWIHDGAPLPPPRHTVQRAVPRRLHHVIDRRIVYRDPCVEAVDLQRIGGVWVTTPVRTLADLARADDSTHDEAARGLGATRPGLAAKAIDWFGTRRIPFRRRAIALLEELAADEARIFKTT